MTEADDRVRMGEVDVEAILEDDRLRSSVVSELKRHCAQDEPLNAQAFLKLHPEFRARKSIVLDLAYEEFCQRLEAGEPVDPDVYCRQFPTFAKSLRRLIDVHEFLEENSHWLPTARVDWPKPGSVFEGFSILAELGRGAFARVFLAREIALGNRLVAVKVSSDGYAEAEILGKLRHPNIVPVFSVRQHEESGMTVVCMPCLGSTTLYDVLDRVFAGKTRSLKAKVILEACGSDVNHQVSSGQLDTPNPILARGSYVDAAIHLVSQLADALAYSHREGVCHSDLKPSNVLITANGTPMLLDFNLAFDPHALEQRLGGTLPYMSPEQLRIVHSGGGTHPEGQAELSDIFSLGVILYEMLSGRLPFGHISVRCSTDEIKTRLLKQHKNGPLPVRQANSQVDPPLARLVESCLALDPAERPQSAEILAAALLRSISIAQRARRWMWQQRWLVRSVAALFLVASLGFGYHLATRDSYAVRQLNRGVRYYRQSEYDKAERYLTLAIEPPEGSAEAFFWRARARQEAGRTVLALEDYEEAAKQCPIPEIKACQAYCWALEGYPQQASVFSNEAIQLGFATAEVYNNLGYSHLLAGDFQSATAALSEAIRRNESLQPALHNRALAELRWAANTQRPLHPSAGTDIDRAIEVGPPTAYLYLDAARIYSRLEKEGGKHRERIIRYLSESLRLGLNPDIIRREFKSLLENPALALLLTDPGPGTETARRTSRLADPLPDDFVLLHAPSARPDRPLERSD